MCTQGFVLDGGHRGVSLGKGCKAGDQRGAGGVPAQTLLRVVGVCALSA